MNDSSISISCRDAAERLHHFLSAKHLRDDGALVGPDAGARWNLRIWRFVKSSLSWVNWSDQGKFLLQAQGYWVLDNLELYRMTGDSRYLDLATRCADNIVAGQTEEGCWLYDSPEWKGRAATVEGCFATLGLLAAYRATDRQQYLDSAERWWKFMVQEVGFQDYDSESKALNYWAYRESGMVPNNATLGLWLSAEMADIKKDADYLEHCPALIKFLKNCRFPSGEFPYILYQDASRNKPHYLCYQYHAFQLLDLIKYHALTHDESVRPLMEGVTSFLSHGILPNGEARYDCFKGRPGVVYYTAAVAAALYKASQLGLGDHADLSDRAYRRVTDQQRSDGGFICSYGNYGALSDKRSYPRFESMILYHLLMRAQG